MPETTPVSPYLTTLLDCCEGRTPEAVLREFLLFTPSPHVVHTASGVRISTRCALDTLLAAWILNENIDIATTPPGEAQPLHLTVRDRHLQAPPDAVLAVPTQFDVRTAEGIHRSFCPYALVFPDAAAHRTWSAAAPVPTTPLSLQAAFQLADDLVGRLASHHTLAVQGGARCC